ncbi:hypothetical protein GMRT_14314 [Giardia muris]|uniref:Uncharacterized protein n=1 Tax=Giardia muris TaxID=5742 RepID=A0A4Z1SZG8_GIAMU|nr:hypothetical protein GMRT_14314 [Giardia muris]|eukprot:TNJ30145.1 hypothetical protein GMRT_14314 [Giardia muris]
MSIPLLCSRMGLSARQADALGWIPKDPVIAPIIDYIFANYSIMSVDELRLLDALPDYIRNLPSDSVRVQLEALEMEIEAEALPESSITLTKLESLCQQTEEMVESLPTEPAHDLNKAPTLKEALTSKTKELSRYALQLVDLEANVMSAKRAILERLLADLDDGMSKQNANRLETFVTHEVRFFSSIRTFLVELRREFDTLEALIDEYRAEVTYSAQEFRRVFSAALHAEYEVVVAKERVKMLRNALPQHHAGQFLPDFNTAHDDLCLTLEEQALLRSTLTHKLNQFIHPSSLSQMIASDTIQRQCFDENRSLIDLILDAESTRLELGSQVTHYLETENADNATLQNVIRTFLGHIETLVRTTLQPRYQAGTLLSHVREIPKPPPLISSGYGTLASALLGQPIRSSGEVLDAFARLRGVMSEPVLQSQHRRGSTPELAPEILREYDTLRAATAAAQFALPPAFRQLQSALDAFK